MVRKIRGGVLLHLELLMQLVEMKVEIKITEYNAHVIVRLSVEKSRIKSIDLKKLLLNVLTLQDMFIL